MDGANMNALSTKGCGTGVRVRYEFGDGHPLKTATQGSFRPRPGPGNTCFPVALALVTVGAPGTRPVPEGRK